MKKSLLTTVCAIALSIGYAQVQESTLLQPTHVIGRRIDANGVITKEFLSDFSYSDDGKVTRYEFPEYALTTNYAYSDDFMTQEVTLHYGGQHPFSEVTNYSYENGQIKTIDHLMSSMGLSQHVLFSYYDDGRLARKDQKEEGDDDYHKHWLYDYENDGQTVVETYWTSWVSQGMLMRKKTLHQYDDAYNLLSSQTEDFNVEGDLTSTTITSYTYTSNGLLESVIGQNLSEGEWVNSSITQYNYDESKRVTERLDGSWNAETNEWTYTKKISFEYSEDGLTYLVSFYKKTGEEWDWDIFDNQTILFGSYLESQQRQLGYLVYESVHEPGQINQFEITFEETERPTYLDTKEHNLLTYSVYPNPGHDKLSMVAPVENAVIRFYDLQGRMILARPFDFATEINAEGWPAGIYLWEIWHNAQKEACGKWIKE